MKAVDKIQKIIDKLEETNYDIFDGDREEAYDLMADSLNSMPNYVNSVVNEQIMMPIISARYDGQDYRDAVMKLDSTRRMCHDNAIIGINMMNRLCENLNLEPFAEVDTTDRHAVADFVGKTVNELYNQGINNNSEQVEKYKDFDMAVEKGVERRGYDRNAALEQLQSILTPNDDQYEP